MKKIIVTLFIVIAFVLYSVIHNKTASTSVPASNNANRRVSVSPTVTSSGTYKDGTYTGSAADAFYGNIQVQATISGGKITNVQFLQYPDEQGRSVEINQQADPMLTQEAIQAQSANVDIVSGATDTSQAFIQSLTSALDQAKA